jgi:hypothetical protein
MAGRDRPAGGHRHPAPLTESAYDIRWFVEPSAACLQMSRRSPVFNTSTGSGLPRSLIGRSSNWYGHGYARSGATPVWPASSEIFGKGADEPGPARCPRAKRKGEPVTSDDDRIAYMAGDAARSVDPGDREDLDRLRALLAEPSTWEEPDPALENRVLAAVAVASGARPSPAPRARSRRFRPGLVYTAFAVAVAVVVAVAVGVTLRGTGNSPTQFKAALAATDLAPGASGNATLTKTTAGWRIELKTTGLPRRDHGRYYEAWLQNAAGILVPIGTFNQGPSVTLWAGVPPTSFPTLTVTEQQTGHSQASSGKRVLTGLVDSRR